MTALNSIVVPLTRHQIDNSQAAHLKDLQGNILKGHGRRHAAHVFITFKADKVAEARSWLQSHLQPRIINAHDQIKAAETFKKTGKDAGFSYFFLLSSLGYQYFGKNVDQFHDEAFRNGSKSRIDFLHDPAAAEWEMEYQADIHAMVLIADAQSANVRFLAKELEIELTQTGKEIADVIHTEFGDQQFNARGNGIEHFGYVDGRSQPLMLESDIDDESDGISLWDPTTGPAQVLIPDPFGNEGATGSYFVFRKLEEKVKAFKTQEQHLANALDLVGEARELAGALVIGRFEDGTPVTLSDEPLIEDSPQPNNHSVPNNFNYSTDTGSRCPFHSHIRKSNPRGNGPTGTVADEKPRHMARRGITYGERAPDSFEDIEDMPEGGVGLLFMSYQKSIIEQFEFIQRRWVNDAGFPVGGSGLDPVIGQGGSSRLPAQNWPEKWNDPASLVAFDFKDFVVMKGGEYFFAPSLSGIGNL